jgi:hypothetical protein
MTRKALARRISESIFNEPATPAPPQPGGLRGFWPGALLLVSRRPQRVFSLLASRTQPKSAAALLYHSRKWCTIVAVASNMDSNRLQSFDALLTSFRKVLNRRSR